MLYDVVGMMVIWNNSYKTTTPLKVVFFSWQENSDPTCLEDMTGIQKRMINDLQREIFTEPRHWGFDPLATAMWICKANQSGDGNVRTLWQSNMAGRRIAKFDAVASYGPPWISWGFMGFPAPDCRRFYFENNVEYHLVKLWKLTNIFTGKTHYERPCSMALSFLNM